MSATLNPNSFTQCQDTLKLEFNIHTHEINFKFYIF